MILFCGFADGALISPLYNGMLEDGLEYMVKVINQFYVLDEMERRKVQWGIN